MEYRTWRHVFKLDPAKSISDADLEAVCESGTDAIIVGGSDGVTLEGVLDLLSRVRRYTVPVVLEVSSAETVTPGFDQYFIPTVLNSRNPKWVIGLHHKAVKEFGAVMDWDEIIPEGYCILNPDCKAARLTEAETALTGEDVAAYALLSEKLLNLPIFYIEYSGTYGDPKFVSEISRKLERARLFYGGGIDSAEKAWDMASAADTVVVGNVIYTNLKEALATVKAVASSKTEQV